MLGLKIHETMHDDGVELLVTGDVDLITVEVLADRIEALEARGLLRIGLDFSGVVYMGSEGPALMRDAHRRLRARGGGLYLSRVSSSVRRVLKLLKMEHLLPVGFDGIGRG